MKKLSFVILLTMLCATTSQITAQNNDSLVISPQQVKNVYVGLKRGEIAQQKLNECKDTAKQLNQLLQAQNTDLQTAVKKITELNEKIAKANDLKLKTAVRIEKLENRKIPWYKHPITYTIIGIAGGIYIAK